jgi:protein tyrosine phosphatase (PTP) superfamily phosphohydrolase (DUF442 family)
MTSSAQKAWGSLLLTVVVAGALFWIFLRYEVFPKRLIELRPGLLFRSGQISERLIRDTLTEHGIRRVIDLQTPSGEPSQQAEYAAVRELGIDYFRFPLGGDGTGDPRTYALAIAAIDDARQSEEPALVHCAGGARRSGGVIAMYGVLVEGRSPDEAYQELDRYGSPPAAETPLVAYLNDNMETIARELVELGVIARVPDPLPRFEPPAR